MTTKSTSMPAEPVEVPGAALIAAKSADLSCDCMARVVDGAASYEVAARMLLVVAAVRAEVGDTFDPVIAAAHAAHKQALAAKAKHDEPLKAAERHLKASMGAWQAAEEHARRERQLLLEAEAAERAAALARAEAEDHALAAAIEAEAHGMDVDLERQVEAELRNAAPRYAAPVIAASMVPKVAGISGRENWRVDVWDLMALVRAVASGQVPIAAVEPNSVFLGQQARSLRTLLAYPGVLVYAEQTVAVRR